MRAFPTHDLSHTTGEKQKGTTMGTNKKITLLLTQEQARALEIMARWGLDSYQAYNEGADLTKDEDYFQAVGGYANLQRALQS